MSKLIPECPMDRAGYKLQEMRPAVNEIAFLKEALKGVSDAFLLIDRKGELKLANESACKLFSLPGDSAIGRNYWDFFSDDYFGFSIRESLTFRLPHRLIYKSHRFLELEISASFLYEGHSLAVVARDISERQRLHALMLRGDRMKELGEIAAHAVHEIRNPLGAIRGFASLLVRDLQREPHLQEMASTIIEGTKTLEKLVSGILHYARPVTVQPVSKDLGALLKKLARSVKVDPAFLPSVQMTLHIPDDPILVPIDPEWLTSALLNLIFNALQAMPRGGSLSLSLFRLEGRVQIVIADTGIGMDPEIQKSLFSPCFTTKKTGNGLGLVETEKIIKAHKGTIELRSEPMKGTAFTITLPLKR